MQPGGPLNVEHRERLRRLLRRRRRRGKAGANSGETVKSWAEYSEVNFTPTGDHSGPTLYVVLLIAVLFILIVPTAFALMENLIEPEQRSIWEMLVRSVTAMSGIIYGLAIFLLAGAIGVILISPFMWFVAQLDGDNQRTRQSLIESADQINARKAAKGQESLQ